MAEIIDLDFYRKFKVILPLYSPTFDEDIFYQDLDRSVKPCRRRRKTPSSFSPSRKKSGQSPRLPHIESE